MEALEVKNEDGFVLNSDDTEDTVDEMMYEEIVTEAEVLGLEDSLLLDIINQANADSGGMLMEVTSANDPEVLDEIEDTNEEVTKPNFKCMICLEPCDNNRLTESTDLVSTFVTIAGKFSSKHFSAIPKKAFAEGLSEAWYCNICYNRIHYLNYLHNKIKIFQEKLSKFAEEIESEILTTYYKEGDSPDENESKKVTELRQRFYKISVKSVPVNVQEVEVLKEVKEEPEAEEAETETEGITITPEVIDPPSPAETTAEDDLDKDDELWTPAAESLGRGGRSRPVRTAASRPRTRNYMKHSVETKMKLEIKDEPDSVKKKTDSKSVTKANSKKKKRSKVTTKSKTKAKNVQKSEHSENSDTEEDGEVKKKSKEPEPKVNAKRRYNKGSKKSQNPEFPCTVEGCDRVFSRKSVRFVHIKTIHEGLEKPHACKECGKCYRTPSKLDVHLRTHSGETPFTCEFCGKSFMASWYLKQHARVHNGDFICSICGKRAVSRHNLEAHINTHTNLKAFVCEVCGDAFATKQYLLFHQANKHEGTTDREPVQCSECQRRFSSNTALRNHLMSAHQIGEPKYRCDVCNSTWNNKRELRIHYNVVHLNERNFECEICHKKFSTANNVKVHKERQHWAKEDRPRPFECTVCGRAFFLKKTMQNHMALHSGDRPFPCGQCDKSFPSRSYLNLHVYTIHDKRQRKTPAPPPVDGPPKPKRSRVRSKKVKVEVDVNPLDQAPPPPQLVQVIQPEQLETLELITLTPHENQPISVDISAPYTTTYYSVYTSVW